MKRGDVVLLIDITTPDGKASGLRVKSAVNCGDLYTVNNKHIIHTIGRLSNAIMQQADASLKAALQLR